MTYTGIPSASATALGHYTQPLYPLFAPQTVAVIGATERPDSIGRILLWNLVSNPFGGTVYPINPRRSSVMGIKTYPDIRSLPDAIDLAVVVTPAETVPGIIGECVEAGVKSAIVISAGFKEVGAEGARLEEAIREKIANSRMRVIGPNCLGVISPVTGLNASFARKMAYTGTVGFLSQSGALCTAILDWSLKANFGFSHFVSLGSMLDTGWGDLIDFLGNDPRTQSIVIYMESIHDARSFLSAAREVALKKPIIVIKAGRTSLAAKAATSHTGALAGSDAVLDAAFRRCGVLRVNTIDELFYMAQVLSRQVRPKGPRLTIVTNAGGPGVLAVDALIQGGGELAPLAESTIKALDGFLPAAWSRGNPVDILGDAAPQRYAAAVDILVQDPNSDGILIILTPQAMTDPTQTAELLKSFGRMEDKPLLASWMGGADVLAGVSILNNANIPTFPYPDLAAQAFNLMWQYSYNLKALYETPMFQSDPGEEYAELICTQNVVEVVRTAGRTLLTEQESKDLLKCYAIPCVETRLAKSPGEAVEAAEAIGYPVVVKLHSETITHKTDVGGVHLNLPDADSVRRAFNAIQSAIRQTNKAEDFLGVTVQSMVTDKGYELILGSSVDPQVGPVILFGAGGELVEVFKDQALALPPLTTTLARRMMERTRVYKALQGVRGRKPANLPALERLLVRFSQLVSEQKWIREIDINPLLVTETSMKVLDARVVLHEPGSSEEKLPRCAIRPYPTQYQWPWTLRNGTPVRIRPIRPDDETLIVRFHEELSEQSVYFYFFHPMKFSQRTSHERLTQICFLDYDRQISLIADHRDPHTGAHRILGVVRLIKEIRRNEGEMAMIVCDPCQRQGLGEELVGRIVEVARAENMDRLVADILPDNRAMQRVAEKSGFTLRRGPDDPVIKAQLNLRE